VHLAALGIRVGPLGRVRPWAMAGLLLLLVFPCPAAAADPARFHGDGVESLKIDGVPSDLSSRARTGLELTPRRGFLTVDRARLGAEALQRDRKRLRLFLARHGFPRAEIEVEAETAGDDLVALVFRVDPGVAARVQEIRHEGLPPGFDPPAREDDAALAEGDRFRDQAVKAARATLRRHLEEAGYARAQVESEIALDDPGEVVVTFVVTSTERFRFDGLEIRGADDDIRDLARRSIERPGGERFTPVLLENARRDLRDLGLFRQVRVRADRTAPNTLEMTVDLTLRELRSARIGIGTWSDHPIQVRAGWRHRDLFGGGRGFEVDGSFALNLRELGASVDWPVLLRRRSRTEFGTRYRVEDEESYGSEEFEVFVDNLFHVDQRTSWRLGTSWIETALDLRTDDVDAFETRPGEQVLFDFQWFHDGVDDLLDPTAGRRVRFEARYAPSFPFADATLVSVRGAWVRVTSPRPGTVLAGRIDLATAWPTGGATDLLPTQRWFGGGFNTHRGATRRGLGPLDDEGDPIGGQWRGLAGLELRQRLGSWLGASMFVDTGQVWREADDVGTDDLVVALGAGPLIYTPIGPVHLDIAWNVARRPADESNLVFHFGIGHAY